MVTDIVSETDGVIWLATNREYQLVGRYWSLDSTFFSESGVNSVMRRADGLVRPALLRF